MSSPRIKKSLVEKDIVLGNSYETTSESSGDSSPELSASPGPTFHTTAAAEMPANNPLHETSKDFLENPYIIKIINSVKKELQESKVPAQLLQSAIERSVRHMIIENIKCQAMIKTRQDPANVIFVKHYANKLLSSMRYCIGSPIQKHSDYVLGESVHLNLKRKKKNRDTLPDMANYLNRQDKAFAKSLTGARVYIPICVGFFESLTGETLRHWLTQYKTSGVKEINILLGEFDDITKMPEEFSDSRMAAAVKSRWLNDNLAVIDEFKDLVCVIHHNDFLRTKEYEKAKQFLFVENNILVDEAYQLALIKDVTDFFKKQPFFGIKNLNSNTINNNRSPAISPTPAILPVTTISLPAAAQADTSLQYFAVVVKEVAREAKSANSDREVDNLALLVRRLGMWQNNGSSSDSSPKRDQSPKPSIEDSPSPKTLKMPS